MGGGGEDGEGNGGIKKKRGGRWGRGRKCGKWQYGVLLDETKEEREDMTSVGKSDGEEIKGGTGRKWRGN